MKGRPDPSEYASYYGGYVSGVPDGPIVDYLAWSGADLVACLEEVPADREGHRYAPGKWSIREVVAHIVDAERMFTTRALAFARGDESAYPAFDENAYVDASGAEDRSLADLKEEFEAVRRGTVLFFQTLPEAAWDRRGVASGNPFTVRSLAWITAGHAAHHGRLIRDRYLDGGA